MTCNLGNLQTISSSDEIKLRAVHAGFLFLLILDQISELVMQFQDALKISHATFITDTILA